MFRLLTNQSLQEKLEEFFPVYDATGFSSEFFSLLDRSQEAYIVIDINPDQQDVIAIFTDERMSVKFAALFPGAFTRTFNLGLIDNYKKFLERPRLVCSTDLEAFLKKINLASEDVERFVDSLFDPDNSEGNQSVWFVTDFTGVLYNQRDIVAMFTDFDKAIEFTNESPTRMNALVAIDFIDEYREVVENEWKAFNLSVLENGHVEYIDRAKTFEVPSNTMYNIVKTEGGNMSLTGREGTFFATSESETITTAQRELMEFNARWKDMGGHPGEEDY